MTRTACIGENLDISDTGQLRLRPWSVPRLVIDQIADSPGDIPVFETTSLPGELMIESRGRWRNDTPVPTRLLIRVTRGTKSWVVSSPNAIQVRDRWSYDIDREPEIPLTSGVFNSQAGSAIDLGTNTVAEPNPGRQWMLAGTHSADEWVPYAVEPGQEFRLWYRAYLWTPPPWSDNANKNNPLHRINAGYTRLQAMAFPQQGSLVVG